MRKDVLDFGHALLDTADLDPVYVMLNRAGLPWEVRARWSLAYWCFYHVGVASAAADVEDAPTFWLIMDKYAGMRAAPRGAERRHFRGSFAVRAVQELRAEFPVPESAARYVMGDERPLPFRRGQHRVMNWRGFGPWISFKVLDMLDAVLEHPVDFTEAVSELFDDPVFGAWRVALELGWVTGPPATMAEARAMVPRVLEYLNEHLGQRTAPHAPHRTLGVQELETILCKFKSHRNGRYPVGKDTEEIRHRLGGWGPLAHRLREVLPHDE